MESQAEPMIDAKVENTQKETENENRKTLAEVQVETMEKEKVMEMYKEEVKSAATIKSKVSQLRKSQKVAIGWDVNLDRVIWQITRNIGTYNGNIFLFFLYLGCK